jgi:hypothetical protein
MKNKQLYIIIFLLTTIVFGCSPKMHIIGIGMRNFNLSQNKYSKNNPYIDKEKNKKQQLKKNQILEN